MIQFESLICILHIAYFLELIIYEFATNRNPTCAEIMLKFSTLCFLKITTSSSFPKSLPDLANSFQLKELIIRIYFICHVILLAMRRYRYSLPYLLRLLLFHEIQVSLKKNYEIYYQSDFCIRNSI